MIDVIKVNDLTRRIVTLEADIKRETNKKQRARLEDEQAAIKFVLRLSNQFRAKIISSIG